MERQIAEDGSSEECRGQDDARREAVAEPSAPNRHQSSESIKAHDRSGSCRRVAKTFAKERWIHSEIAVNHETADHTHQRQENRVPIDKVRRASQIHVLAGSAIAFGEPWTHGDRDRRDPPETEQRAYEQR